MNDSPLSPSWYRVADLRPRLRRHVEIHPHDYRGRRWYVVRDTLSGRHHRFSPVAHTLIGLMDGARTMQQIWDASVQLHGDDAPSQDEAIGLMARLHGADLLRCDVTPDTGELLRRYVERRRAGWKKYVGNPLALRLPLLDADRFLANTLPLVGWMFRPAAALAWFATVIYAAVLATSHRDALLGPELERAFSPGNLLVLWLSYTVIKTLHEFGHAYAVKRWGGEVHEMGISLLVLMPLPYVDASAASTFRDKRQRIVVGAAGIMVELFAAAVATFVWVSVEPGAIRVLAFDIMLIGSVSTLFFNGNPLLRFDGYYMLSDAIGVPNLASRANRYLGYLCQRFAFGHKTAASPANAPGEPAWFVVYGIAAFAYKLFIAFAIALLVSGKLLVVGIVLAVWALFALLVVPLIRTLRFLLLDPALRACRVRAVLTSAGAVVFVLIGTMLVPLPLATRAEGVVWLPEQSHVRAGTDCQLEDTLVGVNDIVTAGQPLLRCSDPFLDARASLLEAKLRELESQRTALWSSERVRADMLGDEIGSVRAALDDVRARSNELIVRAPVAGKWIAPGYEDLEGRFVKQGELIGYVVDFDRVSARVVVPQSDITLVRERAGAVELRLAHRPQATLPTRIVRAHPAASNQLPSRALGQTGGGTFELRGDDSDRLTTSENFFEFDLALPPESMPRFAGGRVYARFDHGSEPLARRWYRALRRLFLRQFDV